jgi:hypothetical protein
MLERMANEPFGMSLKSNIENGLAFGDQLRSLTIADGRRRQQLQPGMMVPVVITGKKS